MSRSARASTAAVALIILAACVADETPSPTPTPVATLDPSPTPTATVASPTASAAPESPTPTPEPSLSLDPPEGADARVVSASVSSDIGPDGGTLTVVVTSAASERIDELVLRWPTELNDAIFLAPFTPSEERIRDGGPPLVQEWTKWVVGPGEQGEPAGTISLGWGPLLPGATLTIELDATRRLAGPVAFDLQILSANDLLTLAEGAPAELRVEIP
jgi:hypothetical protein